MKQPEGPADSAKPRLWRIFDRVVASVLGVVFLFYAYAKFSGSQFMHFELYDRVADV